MIGPSVCFCASDKIHEQNNAGWLQPMTVSHRDYPTCIAPYNKYTIENGKLSGFSEKNLKNKGPVLNPVLCIGCVFFYIRCFVFPQDKSECFKCELFHFDNSFYYQYPNQS